MKDVKQLKQRQLQTRHFLTTLNLFRIISLKSIVPIPDRIPFLDYEISNSRIYLYFNSLSTFGIYMGEGSARLNQETITKRNTKPSIGLILVQFII